MSISEKIASTKWDVTDEGYYALYGKKFYLTKDNIDLLYITVLFQRYDIEWLMHDSTNIDSFKPFELRLFEVQSFLGAIEKFVIENHCKLFESPALMEKVLPKEWTVSVGRIYDVYTKDFYSLKYNTVAIKAKVVFAKSETNVLNHIFTEIRSSKIILFKPRTAQKLLDATEKFVKEVFYKYYERML